MQAQLKSTPGIYVMGFMGCGKTTVGRQLAQRLGWEFVDLDEEVERHAESSIREIFARHGEQSFRSIESGILVEQVKLVGMGQARVVALGGGAFSEECNRDTMRQAGLSIWLNVPLEELWARVSGSDHRPLARDRKKFECLYEERLKDYVKADCTILAGLKYPSKIVAEILNMPPVQFYNTSD